RAPVIWFLPTSVAAIVADYAVPHEWTSEQLCSALVAFYNRAVREGQPRAFTVGDTRDGDNNDGGPPEPTADIRQWMPRLMRAAESTTLVRAADLAAGDRAMGITVDRRG